MARRRRKRIRRSGEAEANINITSLMDVLTVLLFFLLKTMSQTASEINTPKDIRLPAGKSEDVASSAVTVNVSEKELRVNDKLITKLSNKNFYFADFDLDKRTITPLRKVLETEIEKRNSIYQGVGDISFLPEAKVLIQADKSLNFSVIKHVLHTVAIAGYTSYQFVVTKDDK